MQIMQIMQVYYRTEENPMTMNEISMTAHKENMYKAALNTQIKSMMN